MPLRPNAVGYLPSGFLECGPYLWPTNGGWLFFGCPEGDVWHSTARVACHGVRGGPPDLLRPRRLAWH
jgi:hypothetical protein